MYGVFSFFDGITCAYGLLSDSTDYITATPLLIPLSSTGLLHPIGKPDRHQNYNIMILSQYTIIR